MTALASLSALGGFSTAHGECARQWNALIPPSEYRGIPFTAFEFGDGSGSALYIGGAIAKPSESTTHTFVLKFDGANWSEVGGSFTKVNQFGPASLGYVESLGVYQGELIAAGNFNTVGGQSINSIARLHNGVWLPFGEGIDGGFGFGVLAVCEFQDKLIAGGDFTSAGGQPASRIAAWDGTGWSPLGAGITSGSDRTVQALTFFEGKLLVGGAFSGAGGIAGTNRIARWDGTTWLAGMGAPTNGVVYSFGFHNDNLYAGGDFTSLRTSVLKWTGTQWVFLDGLEDHRTNALSAFDGGIIAAGSNSPCIGGMPTSAYVVTQYNGSSWTPMGSGITVFGCLKGIADAIPYHHSLLIVGDLSAGQPFPGSGMATYDPIDPVPSIIEQPEAQSLILGHTFSAEVVAQETMTYQWRRDGVAITDDGRISGATTANLTITDVDFPDGGQYDVLAINDCGQVASEPVTLTIACGGARPNGDLNGDGATDGLDIPLFMDAVLAGSRAGAVVCKADFTYDHVMTDADIGPFVSKLLDE